MEIAENNSLFCGSDTAKCPRHNLVELERKTYYYVGVIIALSLIHGGPAPHFFSAGVADYIVKGIEGVNPDVQEVPDDVIRKSLEEVCRFFSYY